jgi:hypothetical protein
LVTSRNQNSSIEKEKAGREKENQCLIILIAKWNGMFILSFLKRAKGDNMAKYEECRVCEEACNFESPAGYVEYQRAKCQNVNSIIVFDPNSPPCKSLKQKEKKITKEEVLGALDVAIEDPTCRGIDCSPGARCDNDGRGCCPELVRRIEALKKARELFDRWGPLVAQ